MTGTMAGIGAAYLPIMQAEKIHRPKKKTFYTHLHDLKTHRPYFLD